MTRARHPKKEVEETLQEFEATGDWTVTVVHSKGHRWGVATCRFEHRECQIGIWSTPRNAGNHARQIRRAAARCPGEDD
jgi:hypothetical protein